MTLELRADTQDDKPETMAREIVVGRLVVRLGDGGGAALYAANRSERAQFRARSAPVLIRPRSIRGLLDRRTEVAAAISALDAGIPVEISGPSGVGKTAILRHLAHHPRAAAFADGVIYLSVRQQSSGDVLQRIFDSFFERDATCKPIEAEIRSGLQDKHALILLDDVTLAQNELEIVLDSAPRCAFVVAARERRLWGEVRSLSLAGLPVDDAVGLLERDIARVLDTPERATAAALCAALGGHPLQIERAAILIRERALAAESWTAHLAVDTLVPELMTSLDDKQKRMLLTLAAFAGVPLAPAHVAGIAELTDVEQSLMRLVDLNLIVCLQSRYHLAAGVADRLRRSDDLNPWINRAITYFTAWAERHRRREDALADAADALLRVQQHAVEARRHAEVLRLGRLIELALVTCARWDAWNLALERCLVAARASADRSAEGWALHQMGTRAVCADEAENARRFLGQAVSLRESLGETTDAGVSRRNLAFVRAQPKEQPREPVPVAADQGWDLNSLPVRHAHVYASARHTGTAMKAMLIVMLLLTAIAAGAAYGLLPLSEPARDAAPQEPAGMASRAATEIPPPPRATPPPPTDTAAAAVAERANIRIFTARPGSIATRRPTDLCYAVNDASRARIEPGVGEVTPAETLTCRRVTPARTTTYQLSAVGRDGVPVTQQLVIVVR